MVDRINFNLFVLSILMVVVIYCIFSYNKEIYHRKLFLCTVIFMILGTLTRILSVFYEYTSYIPAFIVPINIALYYFSLVSIFSTYSFYTLCVLCKTSLWKTRQKIFFYIPTLITDFLIILSPIFGFVFRVNPYGQMEIGRLYVAFIVVILLYFFIAAYNTIVYKRILPQNYYKCTIIIIIIYLSNLIRTLVLHTREYVFASLCLCLLLFLLANFDFERFFDKRTALLNKKAFHSKLLEIYKFKQNRTLYFMEINGFSYIEKNYDEKSIVKVIRFLSDYLRQYVVQESVYYLEDGKFVIVIENDKAFHEEAFFTNLKSTLQQPEVFELCKMPINITIYVLCPMQQFDSVKKIEHFINGKDTVSTYHNEVLHIKRNEGLGLNQLNRQLLVEEALSVAIRDHKFEIYYQPIYGTKEKKIYAAEALIRLKDENIGFISPEEFIPIAEKNGSIAYIDDFVFDQICRFIRDGYLEELGLHYIEVNMSIMQCMDKNLVDKLARKVKEYQIEPSKINIEITETASPYAEDVMLQQFHRIVAIGFTLSLDDYGTGYSNLGRVMEYPLKIVKLDKCIVWSAFERQANFLTMKNLIHMFHDLKIQIVAEGVENIDQAKQLIELECDFLQGYFYARPCPKDEFMEITKKMNHII